jgi:hypothetical protein
LPPPSTSKNIIHLLPGATLRLLCFALYHDVSSFCAEINANSIESWADDILGAEYIGEYKAIFQKLGGTCTNRAFQAFCKRIAAIKHQEIEEKWKRKKEMSQGTKVVVPAGAGGISATTHLE